MDACYCHLAQKRFEMCKNTFLDCQDHMYHLQVRLQEIPSESIYKNSSKNRAKLLLVFGHFLAEQ